MGGHKENNWQFEDALKDIVCKAWDSIGCHEVRLLFDVHIVDELRSFLTKKPTNYFKKKVIAQDEKYFRGMECDYVVYVGSGHLEAFSRAKLELGIILCCILERSELLENGELRCCNDKTFEGRYRRYC